MILKNIPRRPLLNKWKQASFPFVICISILTSCFLLFTSCQNNIKEGPAPNLGQNPYDTIKRPDDSNLPYFVDSGTIAGVHELVLSKKCAVPACHDGNFEPDYRTVQSAYATLVFAPCIKNDTIKSFSFRVVPFDTAKSWMHYRLVTTDKVLGRMPLYDSLAPWQIKLISDWILKGAPDVFGHIPNLPGPEPASFGIVAFLPDAGNYRVDTIRGKRITNPFVIPKNTRADIWFGLYDDKNSPTQFTVNQVKFSTDAVKFSNPVTMNLVINSSPSMFPGFDKKLYPYYDHIQINTSQFKPGDLVFFRIYVKDADHAIVTEIPEGSANFGLQTYYSFYVGL